MSSKVKTERARMITCILPKGDGRKIVETLQKKKKITTSNVSHARGSGMVSPISRKGAGQQIEKDIVTVMVQEKIAEEIFEFLYFETKINRPHGGLMYMAKDLYLMPYDLSST